MEHFDTNCLIQIFTDDDDMDTETSEVQMRKEEIESTKDAIHKEEWDIQMKQAEVERKRAELKGRQDKVEQQQKEIELHGQAGLERREREIERKEKQVELKYRNIEAQQKKVEERLGEIEEREHEIDAERDRINTLSKDADMKLKHVEEKENELLKKQADIEKAKNDVDVKEEEQRLSAAKSKNEKSGSTPKGFEADDEVEKLEADQSSAVGEPHIRNVAEERFEIRAEGTQKLIQIPRVARSGEHLNLRVDAEFEHFDATNCNSTFITALTLFGNWTEQLKLGLLRFTRGPNRPGSTLHVNTQAPADFFRSFPTPNAKVGSDYVWLKLGKIGFNVAKEYEGRYGEQKSYLNLRVTGLKKFQDLGGILGYDDRKNAEAPPAACVSSHPPAAASTASLTSWGRQAHRASSGSTIMVD